MGLKRIFKKITKPIAKVLDKVIPNEIKPALPYLAAFAPVLGPQMGLLSGLTKLQAAGVYGLGSLGAQLAQEGSEGDFDIAPIIAAAGSAYLAQPGQGIKSLQLNVPGKTTPYPELTFGQKAQNVGIKALQGAEKFFQQGQAASQAGEGILKTTAAIGKAAGPAVTTQITQDAINTAQQALDDYNAELAEYERRTGEIQTASDDARRAAIRAAMIAGGHSEDVIAETFALLGLKDGGRVGLREGGVLAQILPQFQPTLGSFQPLQQAQAVFPRLNQLEQGVNRAEEDLGNIRERLGNELRQVVGLQDQVGLQQIPATNMLSIAQLANRGGGDLQGMKDGGIMDLGGKEMDLRGGGFVPIGKKERADDVPARLSKNEFVMTADAVRGAGGGNINEGARRMYETMNRLEARA